MADTRGSELPLRADLAGGQLAPEDMVFGYVPSLGVNFRVDGYGLTGMISRTINFFHQSQTIDGDGEAEERAFDINVDDGYAARHNYRVGGVLRWGMARLASGHWVLRRYDGSGALLDNPIDVDDVTGGVAMGSGIAHNGPLGFFGATPATKPTITGSRGGNAALASLLTQLAALGLITNSTTA